MRRYRLALVLVLAFAFAPATYAQEAPAAARDSLEGSIGWVVLRGSSSAAFLVDAEQRLLVTSYHVVKEMTEAEVVFPVRRRDGEIEGSRQFYWDNWRRYVIKARVVHRDPKCDLAIVQAERLPAGVKPVAIAPATAAVGQKLYRIGSPGANRQEAWKITAGTIESVGMQRIHYPNTGQQVHTRLLSSNAPPAEGDSGGPVVNAAGQLVGIHAAGNNRGGSLAVDAQVLAELLRTYRGGGGVKP
jgi:S1-C subfamily serine protease